MKSKWKAKKCATVRQVTGIESSKCPDIYTELNCQSFDFTFNQKLNAAYAAKIKKYHGLYDKDVIPIVTSPWYEMHLTSAKALPQYLNL